MHICGKMFIKVHAIVSPENALKIPHLAMLENPLKILYPDPDADDFQNLVGTSLYKDTFMVKKIPEDPVSIVLS